MVTEIIKKLIQLVIIIFLLSISKFSSAIDAEIIWSENIGSKSKIFLNRYHRGVWDAPDLIVESDKLSLLPSVGSDGEGNQVALWVEIQNDGKSKLKYSFLKNKGWNHPLFIPEQQNENLAPVVVYDSFKHPIIFWSSNDGENDDDIFMTRWSSKGWETPRIIHEENNVPDILPEAGMDEANRIWVCWKKINEEKVYIESCRIIFPNGETKEIKKEKIDRRLDNDIKKIEPPTFKFGKSRATVHFPGNRINQSITIRDNKEE